MKREVLGNRYPRTKRTRWRVFQFRSAPCGFQCGDPTLQELGLTLGNPRFREDLEPGKSRNPQVLASQTCTEHIDRACPGLTNLDRPYIYGIFNRGIAVSYAHPYLGSLREVDEILDRSSFNWSELLADRFVSSFETIGSEGDDLQN